MLQTDDNLIGREVGRLMYSVALLSNQNDKAWRRSLDTSIGNGRLKGNAKEQVSGTTYIIFEI